MYVQDGSCGELRAALGDWKFIWWRSWWKKVFSSLGSSLGGAVWAMNKNKMFTDRGKHVVKSWICKDLSVLACKRLEILVLKAQIKPNQNKNKTHKMLLQLRQETQVQTRESRIDLIYKAQPSANIRIVLCLPLTDCIQWAQWRSNVT